jgi:uncharacterized Zn finger protein (UPF0148 family)
MSDFDREAEREKLREQFGEDEADREHSERLSELLLKGATMTNKHCTECGDPIFRHDGREFCPSCQREVASEETQQATAGQAAAKNPLEGDDEAATEPTADGHDGAEPDVEADAGAGGAGAGADAETVEEPSPSVETPDVSRTPDASQPPESSQPANASGASAPTGTPQDAGSRSPSRLPSAAGTGEAGSAGGLMPARQHLTRTVNRLAEQAAAEEDPGRKREFLAATREAAEALAAVRDAE